MPKSRFSEFDEPNMSDTVLLVTVEDMINLSMGPIDKNIVNFKILQQVLHILARQMRVLEQRVEIKVDDIEAAPSRKSRTKSRQTTISAGSSEERITKSPRRPSSSKRASSGPKEGKNAERAAQREKERDERAQSRDGEKTEKEKNKASKIDQKEYEKAETALSKEREKGNKYKETDERAISKEQEKEGASKERDRIVKEREQADRDAKKELGKEPSKFDKSMTKQQQKVGREKEKTDKEKDKAEGASMKEKGKPKKETEKADRAAEKETEKADRAAEKETEKADRAAKKETEKADRATEKEKDEKVAVKDRDKAEKEKARLEKAQLKDREKIDIEQTKLEIEKSKIQKAKEKDSINIKEVQRDKEKVLQVDKGRKSRVDSRTNIEVVTLSKFEILKQAVQELQEKAKPLPPLALPDNQKLREDIVKGSASLTETMQAMKVNARIQAAEMTINRMSDLLTQLAIAGAIPEDVVGKLSEVTELTSGQQTGDNYEGAGRQEKLKSAIGARKSVAISAMTETFDGQAGEQTDDAISARVSRRKSRASIGSRISTGPMPGVVHAEMEEAIKALRNELMKNMTLLTTKAASVADNALTTAKSVAEKLDVAMRLNSRLSTLNSLVVDYAEQLHGFDSGISTQMQSFKEQMTQMHLELKSGLVLLDNVNNNAETAALTELNERYEGLVSELGNTLHTHQGLIIFQTNLAEDLRALLESVEMLREQKADRDEVADGLRDKADNSRLAGLMTEDEFEYVREQLQNRINLCHDKFSKQEAMWMRALRDLSKIVESKADLMHMLGDREDTQDQLRDLHEKLAKLALILGEPMAAILTRKLSSGGTCGACATPALMRAGGGPDVVPPALPALRAPPAAGPARPAPLGAEEPCLQDWTQPSDDKIHICQRWVGGSHTLVVPGVVKHEVAAPLPPGTPTTKYTGKGLDGRLYKMEVDMQPCKECNLLLSDLEPQTVAPAPVDGGGDKGTAKPIDVPLK